MGAYHPWVGPGSGRELVERLAAARKRRRHSPARQVAGLGAVERHDPAATFLERVHSRALELLGVGRGAPPVREERRGRSDRT